MQSYNLENPLVNLLDFVLSKLLQLVCQVQLMQRDPLLIHFTFSHHDLFDDILVVLDTIEGLKRLIICELDSFIVNCVQFNGCKFTLQHLIIADVVNITSKRAHLPILLYIVDENYEGHTFGQVSKVRIRETRIAIQLLFA